MRKEIDFQNNINDIEKEILDFMGKKNISLKTVSSNEFYHLLMHFYEMGQQNPSRAFHDIMPKISRQTFTNRFIIFSDFKRSRILKDFVGFSCLAIDSGTVGPNSMLNCVLLSPHKKHLKPFLYESIYGFIGNHENFVHEISRIINELNQLGISITGIVNDNLPTQVNSTDHRKENSLQKKSDISFIRIVLRIPCQCHVVALGVTDLKKTPFLGGIEQILGSIVSHLRKNKFKKWIGAVCPKICPTRWTNLFDILAFILKHFNRLFCILMTDNPIVQKELNSFRENLETIMFCSLPRLYILMFLYSRLIEVLERNETIAADCLMIYNNFFEAVNFYSQQINDSQITEDSIRFQNSIKKRLIQTGNMRLLIFLASFTTDGRNLIRKVYSSDEYFFSINQEPTTKKDYFILCDKDNEKLTHYISTEFPKIKESMTQYQDKKSTLDLIENIQMNEYFEYDYNSYSSDEYPESGNHIIDNHTNNFEEESNEFIDVIEEISIFNDYDPISYAKTFIHDYCNNMGISEEGMCVMNQQYLTWLIGSSQLLDSSLYERFSNIEIWHLQSFQNGWKEISNLAVKYLSISASEASAERYFSLQRLAISKHRYRTKKKLEEARMVYQYSSK